MLALYGLAFYIFLQCDISHIAGANNLYDVDIHQHSIGYLTRSAPVTSLVGYLLSAWSRALLYAMLICNWALGRLERNWVEKPNNFLLPTTKRNEYVQNYKIV
jgi:hypothetical protein